MKESLPFAEIKVYNEQLQVSELNLPPPELQFNVGLLSEVDEIFFAYYQNSPFHKDHLIIMKLPLLGGDRLANASTYRGERSRIERI